MAVDPFLYAGLGILGNMRPTPYPQSFWTTMGPGLAQGMQLYQQARTGSQREAAEKLRMQLYERQVAAQEAALRRDEQQAELRRKFFEEAYGTKSDAPISKAVESARTLPAPPPATESMAPGTALLPPGEAPLGGSLPLTGQRRSGREAMAAARNPSAFPLNDVGPQVDAAIGRVALDGEEEWYMAAIPHMNRLNAMARAAGESPPTEAALERYAALQLRRPKPRRQAPGVTVNLPPGVPPETPLSKQLAEIDAGLIKESRQQASEAAQQAVSLRQLEVLLEGQKSGKGVPTIREYQGALATFGVELGDQSAVAAYQAAETVAAQLALRARNPEGGLGLTGNTSERDLMFLRSIPPSFAKTPDANKIIFEMHRQVAEYKIKRDKLIQRLARDDNYMSQEDWDKIIEFESSDIFSDDFKKRAARILGMGSEQPATQRRPIDLGLPGFRLLE